MKSPVIWLPSVTEVCQASFAIQALVQKAKPGRVDANSLSAAIKKG